jgi:branched-chain amino acid transport system substrate-binding protein
VFAGTLGQDPAVIDAWAKWTNANGGINGHPVDVVLQDDAGDPAKSTQGFKALIAANVPAIISNTIVDAAWAKDANAAGVPVISLNNVTPDGPAFFPTGTELNPSIYLLAKAARDEGNSNVGVVVCQGAPACAVIVKNFKVAADVLGGLKVSYSADVAPTQPNFTAQCLAAKSSGATALLTALGAATGVKISGECAQQGYTPVQLGINGSFGVNAASTVDVLGNLTMQDPWLPATNTNTPGGKAFHQALETYAPDVLTSEQFNINNVGVFAAGQLFATAAERGNVGPDSSADDVLAGLHTFENETAGGLTPPLTYKEGEPIVVDCGFIETHRDGKLVSQSTKPECVPPADNAKIKAEMQ